METEILDSTKNDIQKLRQLKSTILASAGVFILRYILLITSIIWSDIFVVQGIPVLFICQVALGIFAFAMFCYGLMGVKDFLPFNKQQRKINWTVFTLLTMIVLLVIMLIAWMITNFIPISESFPYELRFELIFIVMPFAELIPLSLAMLFLSFNFRSLRNIEGWNTKLLITPFFLFPLIVVRVLAAILKIINILNPTQFLYAWNMADYSRIVYAILGIILFVEIFINIWRIKPKIIVPLT